MSGLEPGTSRFRVEHSAAAPHDPTQDYHICGRIDITCDYLLFKMSNLGLQLPPRRVPAKLVCYAERRLYRLYRYRYDSTATYTATSLHTLVGPDHPTRRSGI
ncbi:hypothetical protein Bbelb_124830 [Branchiostoma belcheri]|nr:hypothetical protein Bbelb_124830 [Branchiostoma belcheri]